MAVLHISSPSYINWLHDNFKIVFRNRIVMVQKKHININ